MHLHVFGWPVHHLGSWCCNAAWPVDPALFSVATAKANMNFTGTGVSQKLLNCTYFYHKSMENLRWPTGPVHVPHVDRPTAALISPTLLANLLLFFYGSNRILINTRPMWPNLRCGQTYLWSSCPTLWSIGGGDNKNTGQIPMKLIFMLLRRCFWWLPFPPVPLPGKVLSWTTLCVISNQIMARFHAQ